MIDNSISEIKFKSLFNVAVMVSRPTAITDVIVTRAVSEISELLVERTYVTYSHTQYKCIGDDYERRRSPKLKLNRKTKIRSVERRYLLHYRNSLKKTASSHNISLKSVISYDQKRFLKWWP